MYLVVLIAMFLYISLRHITAKMTSYLETRFYVLGSTYRTYRTISSSSSTYFCYGTVKMISYLVVLLYVLCST